MGKVIFFSADDGVHGEELWITDGTAEGTRMVKDIGGEDPNWGNLGSSPKDIASIGGGRVVFSAYVGNEGRELWVSDGSEAGTALLKDINPTSSSSPKDLTALGDGRVVFSANNSQLWVTNGSTDGTFAIKNVNPSYFESLGNGKALFFVGDAIDDRSLWVTDGTEDGTVILRDFEQDSGDRFEYIDPIGNGKAFLRSADRKSLWITDGSPEGTLPFIEGDFFSTINTMPYDRMFIVVIRDGETHYFVSDGTQEGTYEPGVVSNPPFDAPQPMLYELNAGEGVYPDRYGGEEQLLEDGRLLYDARTFEKETYIRSDGEVGVRLVWYGSQLWVTDGTRSGTIMLDRINDGPPSPSPTPSSRPDDFYLLSDGRVLLTAWDGINTNLYVFEPFNLSINILAHNIESIGNFIDWGNGHTLFTASGSQEGIWVTDGTQQGTKLVIPDARVSFGGVLTTMMQLNSIMKDG